MKKTYLITFGLDTYFKNKCVLVKAINEDCVRKYVYDKYGKSNIAFIYDYDTQKDLIDKYKYLIIENIEI